MGIEIERKFLVTSTPYLSEVTGIVCRQGYITSGNGATVRVRIMDSTGYLTIKGKSHSNGLARSEYEYQIPLDDAAAMLEQLCTKPLIAKTRYKIPYEGFIWEVDHFEGENSGLIMAEIELPNEDQFFEKPPWIGREVTGDSRYYNAALQRQPYRSWK